MAELGKKQEIYNHSLSLCTDFHTQQTRTQQFLLSSRWENLTNPIIQIKSPDSSNILYRFNNNTYTDFKTVNKHIFIPDHVVSVISQN